MRMIPSLSMTFLFVTHFVIPCAFGETSIVGDQRFHQYASTSPAHLSVTRTIRAHGTHSHIRLQNEDQRRSAIHTIQLAVEQATDSANTAAHFAAKAMNEAMSAQVALGRAEIAKNVTLAFAKELRREAEKANTMLENSRKDFEERWKRENSALQITMKKLSQARHAFDKAEALRDMAAALKQRAGTAAAAVQIAKSSAEISDATRIAMRAAQDAVAAAEGAQLQAIVTEAAAHTAEKAAQVNIHGEKHSPDSTMAMGNTRMPILELLLTALCAAVAL